MSQVQTLWKTTSRLPLGRRVFSFLFSRRAPYFGSIKPRFLSVEPNQVTLLIPDRRAVHNHIGTVHAIALCNGLEAAMGALAEVSIPEGKRWLPKGMEVAYLAKAAGDVLCTAETDPEQWSSLPETGSDLAVRVRGELADGTLVVEGVIRLWVTARPSEPRPA